MSTPPPSTSPARPEPSARPACRSSHSAAVRAIPAPASRWASRASKSPLTTVPAKLTADSLRLAGRVGCASPRYDASRCCAEVGPRRPRNATPRMRGQPQAECGDPREHQEATGSGGGTRHRLGRLTGDVGHVGQGQERGVVVRRAVGGQGDLEADLARGLVVACSPRGKRTSTWWARASAWAVNTDRSDAESTALTTSPPLASEIRARRARSALSCSTATASTTTSPSATASSGVVERHPATVVPAVREQEDAAGTLVPGQVHGLHHGGVQPGAARQPDRLDGRTEGLAVGGGRDGLAHLTGERQEPDPDVGRRRPPGRPGPRPWPAGSGLPPCCCWRRAPAPSSCSTWPASTVSAVAATASPFTVTRRLSRSGRAPAGSRSTPRRTDTVPSPATSTWSMSSSPAAWAGAAWSRPTARSPATSAPCAAGFAVLIGALRRGEDGGVDVHVAARRAARGSGAAARSPAGAPRDLPFSS